MSDQSHLFDNALRYARSINPSFEPGRIIPQIRPTSLPVNHYRAKPVILLIGYQPTPVYRRDGQLAKRQPAYVKPGSRQYVKLDGDGTLKIMPFEMAGTGYEIVKDAEEGVHFKFDMEAINAQPDRWK